MWSGSCTGFKPQQKAAAPEPTPAQPRRKLSSIEAPEVDPKRVPRSTGFSPTSKKPNVAPVILSISQYTAEAQDAFGDFPAGAPLYVLRLGHEAYPNILSDVIGGFDAFLYDLHSENEASPANRQELRRNEFIHLSLGRSDPENNRDEMPIKDFSVAISSGGALPHLENTVKLVIGFIRHRVTHARLKVDRTPWPAFSTLRIHIHPHTGIDFGSAFDHLVDEGVELQAQSVTLPLSIFDCNPPGSTRPLMAEFEVLDPDHGIIGWDGRTWAFRQRFDLAGVTRVEKDLRVIPEELRDFSIEANRKKILDIFGHEVLRDMICCLKVEEDTVPSEGGVRVLYDALVAKRNIFVSPF